ncbi:MAG: hypothetical protein P9L90_07020 [Candidatus Aadella gelida]|nr:hypothetical protein [Candidatus Aadella gelida]
MLFKIKVLLLTFVFIASMSILVYAELNKAEEEVAWLMEMCETQASIGIHTEGMSKNNMELYLSQCTEAIAETYNASPKDINSLLFKKKHKIPLTKGYKKPVMPTEKEKGQLSNKIKEIMEHIEELDRADKQSAKIRKKYGVGGIK